MTDRELLELAAKAAGYTLGGHTQKPFAFTYGGVEWNPLTDDGDEARLEAALGLHVTWEPRTEKVNVGKWQLFATEPWGTDKQAARRRAGVRAAAEIGKDKP